MSVLQLISNSNFLVVNKELIIKVGLEESILLAEFASEYDYWENKSQLEDGYFYSTVENVEEKTTLSGHKQRKAINNLIQQELIEAKIKGIPAKSYIKINEEKIEQLFNNKLLKNLTTGSEKNEELEVKNFNGNNNIINNNIKENINNIIDVYKTSCTNLPQIQKITDSRKTKIKTFLKKFTLDEFKQICNIANENDFLTGKNNRNWKADFDFLININKANSILEGKYGFKEEEPIDKWVREMKEKEAKNEI